MFLLTCDKKLTKSSAAEYQQNIAIGDCLTCTGFVVGRPVSTSRVDGPYSQKALNVNAFSVLPVLTGDRFPLPVNTGRVDSPC